MMYFGIFVTKVSVKKAAHEISSTLRTAKCTKVGEIDPYILEKERIFV